jgi:hypothetical protein
MSRLMHFADVAARRIDDSIPTDPAGSHMLVVSSIDIGRAVVEDTIDAGELPDGIGYLPGDR